MPIVKKKTCCRCGETKPISAFGKDRYKHDGLYPACKKCKYVPKTIPSPIIEKQTIIRIKSTVEDMMNIDTPEQARQYLKEMNYLVDLWELEQQANSTNSLKFKFEELGLDSYDESQIKAVVSSILINLRKNPSTDEIKTIDLQDGSFLAVITNAEFSKVDHDFIKEYTRELQKM